MSGYTPLFSSLTTGTLCGRWPDIGLWPIILSMSDKNGVVDVTTNYISSVTGMAHQDVVDCMQRFCEPDKYSRSDAENGSRLVLLEEHRAWGWRIVNHTKYREKARKQMQQISATESGRDADRKRIEREKNRAVQSCPVVSGEVRLSPALSGRDRPSDSDSDSDSDSEKEPDTSTSQTSSTDVDMAFEHWKAVHGHPRAKLDAKRRRLAKQALKLFSLEDLCRSISGYKRSAWHMGANPDKKIFDDFALMLRDANQIEQGLNCAEQPKQSGVVYHPNGTEVEWQ